MPLLLKVSILPHSLPLCLAFSVSLKSCDRFEIYHLSGFARRLSADQKTEGGGKMTKIVDKRLLLRLLDVAMCPVKSSCRK